MRTAAFRLKHSRRFRKLMREWISLDALGSFTKAQSRRWYALSELKGAVVYYTALRHPRTERMTAVARHNRPYESESIQYALQLVKRGVQ